MNRSPAVAYRFYPGASDELTQTVNDLLPQKPADKKEAIGVVSPHAGYIYSGAVSAETLSSVHIPETVVIIGPNHHGQGAPIALSTDTWEMPMGDVAVNRELGDALTKACPAITHDESAHRMEHSLEVQVPFLQALQDRLTIVPLAVSQISYAICQEVAGALADAIQDFQTPVLIVASSDMSHYVSREVAGKKDQLALDRVTALDPEGLYTTVMDNRISMCGIIPVTIMLQSAIQLGANTAEITRYTDSGEVSGDVDQVVGYAGAIISKG